MKKTSGWLLVVLAIAWAVTVIVQATNNDINISSILGAVTVPILVGLVGLYLAGIIKNAK